MAKGRKVGTIAPIKYTIDQIVEVAATYLQYCSMHKTAHILGIPEGTVAWMLQRQLAHIDTTLFLKVQDLRAYNRKYRRKYR